VGSGEIQRIQLDDYSERLTRQPRRSTRVREAYRNTAAPET
jgi:hypothetical protein